MAKVIKKIAESLKQVPVWGWVAAGAALVFLQLFVLWFMGQPWICDCGYVKLWEGTVVGPGNSQHITDWYTPSHVLHGFIFYWLATLLWPKAPWGMRLMIAMGVEIGWELLENSPTIIDRYRQTGLAQGYVGDSILNSVSDTIAMVAGFYAAWRIPVRLSLFIIIAAELISLYFIRDGLILNVINLLWPLDFIQTWQVGAVQ